MKLLTGSLSRMSLPLLKWAPDPIVFVEPKEIADYKFLHPHVKFVVHPKNGMGFSGMMNQLVKYTLENGEKYFCFTDDDVLGLRARNNIEEKFERIKFEQVAEVLEKNLALMKEAGAAQWTISFAANSWAAKKAYDSPVGSWGIYLIDAEAIRDVGFFDEELWIFGDWEMSARLIKNGYKVVRTNLVTFEHKMKSMSGGAEHVYAARERVMEACERVKNRYPDACKIKFVEEHGQHEIRFNWKALLPKSPDKEAVVEI